MAKVFGVASFTGPTGFTGAILGVFDLGCESETKILRGNPSSTIVDVRTVTNAATLRIDIIGFEALVQPDTLIGDEVTISITSEDTVGISEWTGIVTSGHITGNYDSWWTASFTLTKKAS